MKNQQRKNIAHPQIPEVDKIRGKPEGGGEKKKKC